MTTVGSPEAARALAGALVGERLAACVTAVPGAASVYRWRGAVETSDEVVVVVKTAVERVDAVVERIRGLHPYEVPEILFAGHVGASGPYAAWVAEETG